MLESHVNTTEQDNYDGTELMHAQSLVAPELGRAFSKNIVLDLNRTKSKPADTELQKKARMSSLGLKSTMTRNKGRDAAGSQAFKKMERTDHLDFAIFRFAQDPEDLQFNARGELITEKSPVAADSISPSHLRGDNLLTNSDIGQTATRESALSTLGAADEKWGPFVRIVSESIFVRMMAERAASR